MQENDNINVKDLRILPILKIWRPSAHGMSRISFDAVFDARFFRSTTGLVAANDKGVMICSKSIIQARIPSPFTVEVMTCSQAVKLAIEMDIGAVEILGDSLAVTKKSQSTFEDKSELRAYICDIQQQRPHFSKIYFRHILRHANKIAHTIAIESLEKGEQFYLEDVVPPYATCSRGPIHQSDKETD